MDVGRDVRRPPPRRAWASSRLFVPYSPVSGVWLHRTTRLQAPESRALEFCSHREGAISSAGERFVHTEEVTGSIPVSPTPCFRSSHGLSMFLVGGPFRRLGSSGGAGVGEHTLVSEVFRSFSVL